MKTNLEDNKPTRLGHMKTTIEDAERYNNKCEPVKEYPVAPSPISKKFQDDLKIGRSCSGVLIYLAALLLRPILKS